MQLSLGAVIRLDEKVVTEKLSLRANVNRLGRGYDVRQQGGKQEKEEVFHGYFTWAAQRTRRSESAHRVCGCAVSLRNRNSVDIKMVAGSVCYRLLVPDSSRLFEQRPKVTFPRTRYVVTLGPFSGVPGPSCLMRGDKYRAKAMITSKSSVLLPMPKLGGV
jgi:hypothetical protein